MIKLVSTIAAATIALTSVAIAAPFDPAYTTRDRQIEAQLRLAPAATASAYAPSYDPAFNSSDDRAVAARAADETGAVATHDVIVNGYVPTMLDRFESHDD